MGDVHQAPDTGAEDRIAVIGLSCRVPGADDVNAFWSNLVSGIESITAFDRETLLAAGWPARVVDAPDFVPAKGLLNDAYAFDAAYFGIPAREAGLMDPQQRVFLELAQLGLEDAGHGDRRHRPRTGIFAGQAFNTHLPWLLRHLPTLGEADGMLGPMLGNGPDYLCTRAAYKLGLTGPAVTVQTACSSSLVAVHQAVQSLLNRECDIALAGGVTVRTPQVGGHLYQPGGALAAQGHCRPFDAAATGLVNGCGAGVVVLRRYEDAVADGDAIRAVIRATAVNNDGAFKQAFTAPNPAAQEAVIREALHWAGVTPHDIDYIEAHGTGTPLGDALEAEALGRVFHGREQPCHVGAVKANIGHLDAAAGVIGLIKVILAMQHRTVPPQVNYDTPPPTGGLDPACLSLPREALPWPDRGRPPLAGVSSFGFGGTNVHAVVEGVPTRRPHTPAAQGQGEHLICVQARTPQALRAVAASLATAVRTAGDEALADIAATLRLGRPELPCRAAAVVDSAVQAAQWLDALAQAPAARDVQGPQDPGGTPSARALAQAWSAGASCDWLAFQGNRPWRRVSLPGYAFERQPVTPPVETPEPTPANTVPTEDVSPLWAARWLDQPEAAASAPMGGVTGATSTHAPARTLLIHHGDDFSGCLASALGRGSTVVSVKAGQPLDPSALTADTRLVYACQHGGEGTVSWKTGRALAVMTQMAEAVTAARAAGHQPASVDLFGVGIFDVLGGEVQAPHAAAAHALLQVLRQEQRLPPGRTIDVDPWAVASGRGVRAARQAVADLVSQPHTTDGTAAGAPLAWRGRRRFQRGWVRTAPSPMHPGADTGAGAGHFIRAGGVYALVGGTGGLGLALARHLATLPDVRLALWSRSISDGDSSQWARRIGIEPERLLAIGLDITESASVFRGLGDMMREFGQVDGIFHLASAPADGDPALASPQAISAALGAKLRGAESLVAALPSIDVDDRPRFLALVSSLTGLVGGPGLGLYAAANAALEAYATSLAHTGDVRVVALALDRIPGVGMAAGGATADGAVDLSAWPWLAREHRAADTAFLPGTAALDLLLDSASRALGRGGLWIHEASLLRPMTLSDPTTEAPTDRVTVTHRWGAAETTGSLHLALHEGGSPSDDPVARMRVSASATGAGAVAPTQIDLPHLFARCGHERPAPGATDLPVVLGPRWGALIRLWEADGKDGKDVAGQGVAGDTAGEWLAELSLPEAARADAFPGPVHPAFLDVALSAALAAAGCAGFVPVGYRDVEVLGAWPFPDQLISHLRGGRVGAGQACFAVDVMDREGMLLMRVGAYELRQAAWPTTPPASRARGARDTRPPRLAALGPGLAVDQAVAALIQGVENTAHTVLWATRGDLAAATATSTAASTAATATGPARAPRGGPEGGITPWDPAGVAAIVAEVLGVPRVDPDDDFFALGGDSILALDIVTRLNASSQASGHAAVGLSATDLYTASTPRALAARLAGASGTAGPDTPANRPTGINTSAYPDAGLGEQALADVLGRFAASNGGTA